MSKRISDSVEVKKEIPMSKIILEKVKYCKFVRSGSVANGHDCWGATEYSSYEYVWVGNEEHKVYGDMYVIHDGENVLGTGTISLLDTNLRKHLDEDCIKKIKEQRYQKYLELDKEFGNDPIYVRDKRISKVID